MTQHPSLKSGQKGDKFRSVLKRFEKIKELTEKEKWDEEKDSIYKLPKIRRIKFKVKKTKGPAEEEGAEGAEGIAPGAGAPAGKEGAAPAQGAPAGKQGAAPAGGKKDKK